MRARSRTMPEGMISNGHLHTLPSVSSSQEGASALGLCALDVRRNKNNVLETDLDMSYASWRRGPDSLQQLATFSSSSETIQAGRDYQDNPKEGMVFSSLPMLEQHQIILEDGSIGTYYVLPRDSGIELLQQRASHGKLTSPYSSPSISRIAQEKGSLCGGTNLQELCLEDVLEARLRSHDELGEAVSSLSFVSRKRRSLQTEDDLCGKRPMGLERADFTQFERRVQRELEDLFHAVEDANWACGRPNQYCTLPSSSHACAREGMLVHNSGDYSPPHDNDHASIEDLSNHVHGAFMSYAKVLNELPEERTKLEKQGKGGMLLCLTCKRFSKPYPDTHSLVMHTFMSRKRGLRAEHLGLRKAICTVMGWSTTLEPSIWKKYQQISSEEAKMNREDLILWPPALVIHNALARESSDCQARDAAELAVKDLFKDAGLSSWGIEVVVGSIGTLLVEYSATSSCLLEAEQLHLHLATKSCGRDAWRHKSEAGKEEMMPKGKRILYGYLACAHDLNLVDRDFRRRCVVLSRKRVLAGGSLM